jgi:hypothetical protein
MCRAVALLKHGSPSFAVELAAFTGSPVDRDPALGPLPIPGL